MGVAEVEILRANGERETRRYGTRNLLSSIKDDIGCQTVDTVNLRDGRVMLVGDDGYETEIVVHPDGAELRPTKARKPVNAAATKLYWAVCVPGTTHKIVGDVAIVKDEDFA